MRPAPKTIFIACEGRNSEYIYFERIKEAVEEDGFFAITVYPDRNETSPKTDVIGLVNEARSKAGDFDELWVVYDKNGYTKHEEAIVLAGMPIGEKTVNLAFSSIAFEHWVLLHFEKNQTAFVKADCKDLDGKPLNCGTGVHANDCMGQRCVAGVLRSKGHYPDYSKKTHIDIYTTINDRLPVALENAAWLRYRMAGAMAAAAVHTINPYTDVDTLIKRLLRIEENISWHAQGSAVTKDNLTITVSFNDPVLELSLANGKGIAVLLNQLSCSVINDEGSVPVIFPNEVVPPGETITRSLNLDQAGTAIRIIYESHHLFFET